MTSILSIACIFCLTSCWDGEPARTASTNKAQDSQRLEPYLDFATQEFAWENSRCENGGFSVRLKPFSRSPDQEVATSQGGDFAAPASFISCLEASPTLPDVSPDESLQPEPFQPVAQENDPTGTAGLGRPARAGRANREPLPCGDYPWKTSDPLLEEGSFVGQEATELDPALETPYLKWQLTPDSNVAGEVLTKVDRLGITGLWVVRPAPSGEEEIQNTLTAFASWLESGEMPNLEVLCLANMGLTRVDWLLRAPKLRHLDVSDNALKDLPDLSQLPSLEFIDLRHNPLKSFGPLMARIHLAQVKKEVFRWRSSWDQYGRTVRLTTP